MKSFSMPGMSGSKTGSTAFSTCEKEFISLSAAAKSERSPAHILMEELLGHSVLIVALENTCRVENPDMQQAGVLAGGRIGRPAGRRAGEPAGRRTCPQRRAVEAVEKLQSTKSVKYFLAVFPILKIRMLSVSSGARTYEFLCKPFP